MVEIINNVRRSLICWRGRRELITDVRKPGTRLVIAIVGGELFTDYPDHPRKLVTLNPNSNQQAPDATSFSCWWDAYRKQLGLKDFLRKVRDAVVTVQIKERGAYLWLTVDIRQAIDRCSNIWAFNCRALVMVSSSIRLDSLIAKIRAKRAERSEIDVWAESPRLSRLVICIIVCLSWAVNHYRDNITYKAQRDKKCQRTKAMNGNTSHADALGRMLLRSMQNTRRS